MTHCAMTVVYTSATLGYSLQPFIISLGTETKTKHQEMLLAI